MKDDDKVNYDEISQDYDLRYQENDHQGILETLRRFLSKENPLRVLEVGAGTGHWLKALNAFGYQNLFGVDRSLGMLNNIQQRHKLFICQGEAENLPFMNESMDFVFCVNALHHFSGKEKFISEAFRVLHPGGILAIIGMDPHDKRNRWYIYDFFEGTRQRDLVRFPTWDQVEFWFRQAGFHDLTRSDVDFIHDPKTTRTVLNDRFLQKNACSQLSLLSDRAYQKGIEKIREIITLNSSKTEIFPNDILLSMQMGNKPKIEVRTY